MMGRRVDGQSSIEYLMIMIIVLLFMIWGIRSSGPLQEGMSTMLGDVKNILTNMAQNAAAKF